MNAPRARALRDFVWTPSRSLSLAELPDAWDAAAPAERARWNGQFGAHWRRGDRHWLLRDRLGVHKRFYAIGRDGELHTSHFAHDLVRAGVPFDSVRSVPSGHVVEVDTARRTLSSAVFTALPFGDPDAPMRDLAGHAEPVRTALNATFARLAAELRGREVVVTLSGGLDSSTIAALAHEHLGVRRAITFTTPDASSSKQSDLHFARRVAAHVGLDLEVVEASPAQVVGHLDEVLTHGQDFRDFNVHCGLVNAVLAAHLTSGRSDDALPVVLTGDGMNELVSDYAAVEYAGERFYELPEMSPGRLRRFLVMGLDSGDREVGIFGRRGIDCVQPYLLCADAYLQLPGGFLSSSHAKRDLVRHVMGERIPAEVYERPKVRAQVGSGETVGGALAATLAAGMNASALRDRFAALFGVSRENAEKEARAFIRGGLYRAAQSFPRPHQEGLHHAH